MGNRLVSRYKKQPHSAELTNLSFTASIVYSQQHNEIKIISQCQSLLRRIYHIVQTAPILPTEKRKLEKIGAVLGCCFSIFDYATKQTLYTTLSPYNRKFIDVYLAYDTITRSYVCISHIERFLSMFCCKHCQRPFLKAWIRERHETSSCPVLLQSNSTTDETTNIVYTSLVRTTKADLQMVQKFAGRFHIRDDILDELEKVGLYVAAEHRADFIVDKFCVFDTESAMCKALLDDADFAIRTECYEFTRAHRALLLCVADNILPTRAEANSVVFRARQPHGDPMLQEFVDHLMTLQAAHSMRMRARLHPFIEELNALAIQAQAQNNKHWYKRIKSAARKLDQHCERLHIFGFNIRRYDMSVLAFSGLFQVLSEQCGKLSAVKKGTGYMSVRAGDFVFLDWLSFLSPVSLRVYLQSVFPDRADLQKLYFPYSVLSDFSCLDRSVDTITYADFDDEMLGCNALAYDYDRFEQLLADGCSERQAMKEMGLRQRPQSGDVLFTQLHADWHQRGYTTVYDVCNAYIRQDCVPLLLAISKKHRHLQTETDCRSRLHQLAKLVLKRSFSLPSSPFSGGGDDI